MAERIEEFTASCAAGGVQETNLSFSTPNGEVEEIVVVIPNGHANLTGLQIFYAGSQIIPKLIGALIKGNNRQHRFTVDGYPTGDDWSVIVTNNGTKTHSFHLYFHFNEIVADVTPLPPVVLLPYQS